MSSGFKTPARRGAKRIYGSGSPVGFPHLTTPVAPPKYRAAKRKLDTPGLKETHNIRGYIRNTQKFMEAYVAGGGDASKTFNELYLTQTAVNNRTAKKKVAVQLGLDSDNVSPLKRFVDDLEASNKSETKTPSDKKRGDATDGKRADGSSSMVGGGTAGGAGGVSAGVDGGEEKHCDGKNPCPEDADAVQQGNVARAQEPPGAPQAPVNSGTALYELGPTPVPGAGCSFSV